MANDLWNRMKTQYIFWWARRLPACDELLPWMSLRMDGKLSWKKRAILSLHNHICDWCRRYASHLLLLREAMRQQELHPENTPLSEATLSPDAHERMKRAIEQK